MTGCGDVILWVGWTISKYTAHFRRSIYNQPYTHLLYMSYRPVRPSDTSSTKEEGEGAGGQRRRLYGMLPGVTRLQRAPDISLKFPG